MIFFLEKSRFDAQGFVLTLEQVWRLWTHVDSKARRVARSAGFRPHWVAPRRSSGPVFSKSQCMD